MTVSVLRDYAQQGTPPYVRVRVGAAAAPSLSVATHDDDVVTVLSTEPRLVPGWGWVGEFPWERRQTVRTTTYTPVASGVGGGSPTDTVAGAVISWFVGGTQIFSDMGTVTVTSSAGRRRR